jgi:dephospho-CoA kinase
MQVLCLFRCFTGNLGMKKDHQCGLRVGITGGIGSGKSTVCRIFESLGIPVYNADYWAKWLLSHDHVLKKSVIHIFGEEAYASNGDYDTQYVSRAVFSDPEKLSALNAVAHPAVEVHSRAWHSDKIKEGYPYTLKEAALLVESGGYKQIDFLIVVTAPEPLRIKRVIERDHTTEAQVRSRMQFQLPEMQKVMLADGIIVNDGQHSLVQQVWRLHHILLLRSQETKTH